jgi:O-methyltransferase
MRFVKGLVEETIPDEAPSEIALLRLDTDWESSTRHELEHLWPRLAVGGVLIVDDYGHWAGARAAVDAFFATREDRPLLNRIDYTGRIAVRLR